LKMNTKQKIAVLFIVIMTATSCIKEESPLPRSQVVRYSLSCEDCLIQLESDKWNRYNELDRSKNQYFNVTGSFVYSFDNPVNGLDTASAVVSVSVLYPREQVIRLVIMDNQGRRVYVTDTLGFSPDYRKDDKYEVSVKLPLK